MVAAIRFVTKGSVSVDYHFINALQQSTIRLALYHLVPLYHYIQPLINVHLFSKETKHDDV